MVDECKNISGQLKPYPLYRRLVKIILWTVFALVLALYGTITCLVSVLSPDKLTPIVSRLANNYLDADVTVSKVEFSAMSTYPYLRLDVDSLTVVSPVFSKLKNDTALYLPSYSDTLFSIDKFVGELNLPALFTGELNINNVILGGLAVNVVTANDSVGNYNIFRPSDAESSDEGALIMPEIVLHHFVIDRPKELRYYDAQSKTCADLILTAELSKDNRMPFYHVNFGGNLNSPLLGLINLSELPFGFDGDIIWNSADPYKLVLEDCRTGVDFIGAEFDLGLDFGKEFTVQKFDVSFQPIGLKELLSVVPDSLRNIYHLDALKSDAVLCVSAHLDSAFNFAADTIPYASAALEIPKCKLIYGNARFESFATTMALNLRGNDLNDATLNISSFDISGPATDLKLSAKVSEILTDPLINARVDGYTNLSKLPPPIMNHIDGHISGALKAAVSIIGRPSMFDRNKFHLLRVDGDLDGRQVYWLSSDTSNMVFVNDACLQFGTNKRFEHSKDLLAATVKIDSIDALSGGTAVNATALALGIAAENSRPSRDTTLVVPMGGGLSLKTLTVESISDSAGVRFRDISGRVAMRRYDNMLRVPEFIFNLAIKRMAAGSLDARMLFSDSKLDFNAHKLPPRKISGRFKRTVDSIRHLRPDIPLDSVYMLAIKRHSRHHGHRVHSQFTDSMTEIIDWGTSKGVRRLLLGWKLQGVLSSGRAVFFTPHFPLRNRLENFNVTFNNDSLAFSEMAYKVGRSDFLAAGKVTNIRRSLTSRKGHVPLKLQFETLSDTVDVNQIADGFFRGAAYSRSRHKQNLDLGIVDNDDFERELDASHDVLSDTMSPLLIPFNIEADIKVKAKNILYSDLLLHDMDGSVLVYDGAVNLHRLKASSEIGSVDLSALYSAPDAKNMRFGFGLQVNRFDIERFMTMIPALDSIMPLLRDISGIIDADIAATSKISSNMDIDLPSLTAAIKLHGDSLQLLDAETFRTIAKWLMFKNKKRNIIDHMNVELIINDNQMYLYPFIFDIDRYRLGVQGQNDLALNFNYLISVLKSPLPFKFGITLKGNPDDYKIRLGRAKFDEKQALQRSIDVDTTRINLIDQIENVFRRGVRRSEFAKLKVPNTASMAADIKLDDRPVSAADSLVFINEGLIPAPQAADVTNLNSNERND